MEYTSYVTVKSCNCDSCPNLDLCRGMGLGWTQSRHKLLTEQISQQQQS